MRLVLCWCCCQALACSHRVYLDDLACGGHEGPSTVRIEGVCIDSTEVTQAQYQRFLGAAPKVTDQLAECAWNDSFVPADWPPPDGTERYPVGGVDQCDAAAYCKWAGKRLCGHVGGGAVFFTERADATTNEWYRACSRAAARRYPYGDSFDGERCATSGAVVEVGSRSGCEGGYSSLFDMLGNVWEWTDSCNSENATDPELTQCDRRGGATTVMPEDWACDGGELIRRNLQQADTGIRCCSD